MIATLPFTVKILVGFLISVLALNVFKSRREARVRLRARSYFTFLLLVCFLTGLEDRNKIGGLKRLRAT